MEKQGLLNNSGMFMKMKEKNCVDVDNLLRKGAQQLSLSLAFQVSYTGLFPVFSTLATPTILIISASDQKRQKPAAFALLPTLALLISHCVRSYYSISEQGKRQASLRCVFIPLVGSFVLHKVVKPDLNVECTLLDIIISILAEVSSLVQRHTSFSQGTFPLTDTVSAKVRALEITWET